MLKRYLDHVQSKPTHHRRQHAVQVAAMLTALAFVVWITTLPLRFGGAGNITSTDGTNGSSDQTQLAGVGAADTNGTNDSGLQVVGATSTFSNY
ncbi:MAG TPA: hypothetical protein VG984_02005 [Candidatus Paceibacterota bacterium]|nr:hypothetical protein [Candidatus Paceibacterota bacterium]